MTAIEDIQNHINSLSDNDWNRIFNLIPEIEQSDKFGNVAGGEEITKGVSQFPYWDWSEITQKFVKVMYDLNLVINFDWMEWKEGSTMLQNENPDFSTIDSVTLCKLLTTIIRADRFNDGFLIGNFENGNILKIVKALNHNVNNNDRERTISKSIGISDMQKQFIWLAYGEGISYSDISKRLGVDRKTMTGWENDEAAIEFRKLKSDVSAIRKLYITKKIPQDFNSFKDWYLKIENSKRCAYCGITEDELGQLWDIAEHKGQKLTKRSRGRKLELDRMEPNLHYKDFDNIVYACYWCNNAKTDTFTHEEFQEVGKVFSKIWKKRLSE